MQTRKLLIKKLGRGQYQVIDEEGRELLPFPDKEHAAAMFIRDEKYTPIFIANQRIRKAAINHLRGRNVNTYGDIDTWLYGYAIRLDNYSMREMMKRPDLFIEHVTKLEASDKKARHDSLKSNPVGVYKAIVTIVNPLGEVELHEVYLTETTQQTLIDLLTSLK